MGKSLSDEAFDRAAAALEHAGFFPTGVEVAKAARERTIVYMRSPDGEVAKPMSVAIPGGADRAKLDWSSKFDAIVALDASADKSREADRPSPEEGVVTCVLKKPLEVDEDGEAEYRCAGTGAAFSLVRSIGGRRAHRAFRSEDRTRALDKNRRQRRHRVRRRFRPLQARLVPEVRPRASIEARGRRAFFDFANGYRRNSRMRSASPR